MFIVNLKNRNICIELRQAFKGTGNDTRCYFSTIEHAHNFSKYNAK